MRWQNFFSELEQEFEAALGAEERDHHNDELRLVWAQTSLQARLAHSCATRPQLDIELGGISLTGEVAACGWDWISGEFTTEGASRAKYCVIPSRNIEISHLDCACLPQALDQVGSPARRIPLSIVLRDLARRRRAVDAMLHSGRAVTGTIQRVGKDWCDLAPHGAAEVLPTGPHVNVVTLSLRHITYLTVCER